MVLASGKWSKQRLENLTHYCRSFSSCLKVQSSAVLLDFPHKFGFRYRNHFLFFFYTIPDKPFFMFFLSFPLFCITTAHDYFPFNLCQNILLLTCFITSTTQAKNENINQ
ncbi:unnamed protein product [Onchocerca flexuosa]|uniref:Uncharacterized protein n=1 Tax=Onchocerca flexuosa TaxID=387005 RepID=A0A183H5U3_9BILA|nr:unnamed protein product [Onchocerca flexuosa]